MATDVMKANLDAIVKDAQKRIQEDKQKVLDDKVKQVKVVEVIRQGDKILLPIKMTIPEAIETLHHKLVYESEMISLHETIDAFVWDGAVGFKKAMDEMFGVVFAKPDFWMPPTEINVETDAFGGKVAVPWGKFTFPGATNKEEVLMTSMDHKDGRQVFKASAYLTRAHKSVFSDLVDLAREYVRRESIYRGKAFRLSMRDRDGDLTGNIEPKFLDLTRVNPANLVFREELMRAIETNIWTPLKHREETRKAGVPFKRGVLLAGPYGTGKTLAAHSTALHATNSNITFIYLSDSRDLAEAIRFAGKYSPAVIFAEDIDRAASGEERTVEIDQILNTIDGVDSKNAEVMVVLTTNHLEEINSAMLRPGRLDVVLNVLPPDAPSVMKLIRIYANGMLEDGTTLEEAGSALDGQIPAVIREVVERSKLEVIRRLGYLGPINDSDLNQAVYTVMQQQALFAPKVKKEVPSINAAIEEVIRGTFKDGNVEVTISEHQEEIMRGARNAAGGAHTHAAMANSSVSEIKEAIKDVPKETKQDLAITKKIADRFGVV